MTNLVPRDNNPPSRDHSALTFNLAAALPGRVASRHTERAYFRWIETYLVDLAGWKASAGIEERSARMTRLPVQLLQAVLSAQQLRAWLGMLMRRNHSKQGINQARASIVTLGELMAEANWLDELVAASLARVKTPRAETSRREGRWLTPEQLRLLMLASSQIATSANQAARNAVAMSILCTMALRREELAAARWGDLSVQNGRAVLRVRGKGRKSASLDVPQPVLFALEKWSRLCVPVTKGAFLDSKIIRRIWKGGRISQGGMTPEGILLLVDHSARQAGLGPVAPHDLRRSVAGALYGAKVPIDTISRLLRHSNIAVTERYIKGLQLPNEGALLMSDILSGLDDAFGDFPTSK